MPRAGLRYTVDRQRGTVPAADPEVPHGPHTTRHTTDATQVRVFPCEIWHGSTFCDPGWPTIAIGDEFVLDFVRDDSAERGLLLQVIAPDGTCYEESCEAYEESLDAVLEVAHQLLEEAGL